MTKVDATSSALRLMDILRAEGADVRCHDPFVDALTLKDGPRRSVELTAEALEEADCVVDTRNATRGLRSDRAAIVKL